ncbi:Uncharacterised protein [Chlamydia trachomatis]|nr:Uncharacterised protein [Chlamydia trachomatis]
MAFPSLNRVGQCRVVQGLSPNRHHLRSLTIESSGQSGVGNVNPGGVLSYRTPGTHGNTGDGNRGVLVYAYRGRLHCNTIGALSGSAQVLHLEGARYGACARGLVHYLLGDFQFPGLLGVGVGGYQCHGAIGIGTEGSNPARLALRTSPFQGAVQVLRGGAIFFHLALDAGLNRNSLRGLPSLQSR